MKAKITFFASALAIFLPILGSAEVRRICSVSYRAEYGWSTEHTVEVAFLTGHELNSVENDQGNPAYNPNMPGPDWVKWTRSIYAKLKGMKANGYRYNLYSNYACIWFSQEEVAILELSGYVPVAGNVFTSESFRSLYSLTYSIDATQLNSPGARKWRIRAKENYFPFKFVDPRENRNN